MAQKTAFLAVFPGQGAQHVGMAKALHENFAIVRETFEEASDAATSTSASSASTDPKATSR